MEVGGGQKNQPTTRILRVEILPSLFIEIDEARSIDPQRSWWERRSGEEGEGLKEELIGGKVWYSYSGYILIYSFLSNTYFDLINQWS